jgi:hypothetical protein
LLLDLNDNVTSLQPWIFICFTVENVLFSIRGSLIYLCFKDLFLFDDFLSVTCLALVFFTNNFTLSIAIITWSLSLSIHSWAKHLHRYFHASALASTAFLDSSCFSSFAFTFATYSLPIDSNFRGLSIIQIFKSCFDRMHHRFSFLRALAATAASTPTSKHFKYVAKALRSPTAISYSIFTMCIIQLPLFGVT